MQKMPICCILRHREIQPIPQCQVLHRPARKICPHRSRLRHTYGYMYMTDDNLVFQSYGRCCKSTMFFDDFYRTFLASSPEISAKFANTNLEAQKHLLRAGILNLIMYARGLPPTKLKALAESHAKNKLNIEPRLYDYWLESLLSTVRKYDTQVDQPGLDAWRRVMAQGIAVIKSGY